MTLFNTQLLRRGREHLTVNELPYSKRKFLPDLQIGTERLRYHVEWVQLAVQLSPAMCRKQINPCALLSSSLLDKRSEEIMFQTVMSQVWEELSNGALTAVGRQCSEPQDSPGLPGTIMNDNHHWHSTSVSLRAETPATYPTLAGKWSWWPSNLFHL